MRGAFLILFAACLWGTTGTAQELGPESASPLAVGWLRLVIGAAALILIALWSTKGARWRWLFRPATFIAGAGMAAYQPFFFSGVARTGVAVGTVLALGSAPVFVGAIESVLARRPPNRAWIGATVPAILGLLVLGASRGGAVVDVIGVLFALSAGLSYAIYTVSAARLARQGPIRQSVAAIFGLAAVLLMPLAITQDLSFAASENGLAMILWLGLAATAVAYLLFTSGLRVTDASTASTLTLGEPVTATILAVLVLGETPGTGAWAGIALIGAGLVLATRNTRTEVTNAIV